MVRTETTVQMERHQHRYFWPLSFLLFWLLIMWATAITQIVVFSLFMQQQSQFQLGTPWLFPYGVTVGSLTIIFLIYINIQMAGQGLVPWPMMYLSFVYFALYLTGLIETSIQLFGAGNVSGNCSKYISGSPVKGPSIETLAWLEQNSICQSWYSSFAFWIVGVVFLVWMFFMAWTVSRNQVDEDQDFVAGSRV